MKANAATPRRYEAGEAWLANCSAHPDLARKAWSEETLAPIASGTHWLVAESHLRHALPAAVRIGNERRGPVLAHPEGDRAWWLVPPGTEEQLSGVRWMTVKPSGWTLLCPPTGRQVDGHFWLWRPDGSGHLTDPAVLAAAYGPVALSSSSDVACRWVWEAPCSTDG
ncbi:hypothetical protein AB0K80_00290 [Streptomyces sp. NPDC052682]|uniref:hypothetical protein n=1 Tax=Streptomyces sp. NPDC052682 TaxID=3154954 RepID=UPI0034430465